MDNTPLICNPISREYMKLPPALEGPLKHHSICFGFGVSKLTGEYKVVRLFYDRKNWQFIYRWKCEVCSLRTGLWRSVVTAGLQLGDAQEMSSAVFSDGNLHWLVGVNSYEAYFQRILCFDLETESFSTFSIPDIQFRSMSTLGDCLCLHRHNLLENVFEIWLMKTYGDDKSWTKEFVINKHGLHSPGLVVPIKVFEDGDIFLVGEFISKLYCYASKTKTSRVIIDAKPTYRRTFASIFTPSFVPLKTFTIENNVISY